MRVRRNDWTPDSEPSHHQSLDLTELDEDTFFRTWSRRFIGESRFPGL
jgi:hypothetical protein